MREIKFRGINMEGQWVYGYLGKDWDNDVSITTNFDSDVLCSCEYKVFPESVGQYTGLKDKNGREIYEGDIVRCYGGSYWNGIYEYNYVIEVRDIRDLNEIVHSENVEILGNKYENPELLEVEGEMNAICPTCNGSGGIDTFEESIGEIVTIACPDCGGSGEVTDVARQALEGED